MVCFHTFMGIALLAPETRLGSVIIVKTNSNKTEAANRQLKRI
jgi:hypothetical protein